MTSVRWYRTAFTLVKKDSKALYTCVCRTSTSSATVGNDSPVSADVKPFSELPGPRGIHDLPYIGTMLSFKPFTKYTPHEIYDLVTEMSISYGDIFKMRFGKEYLVYVNTPDLAKTVLQANYVEHNRIPFDLSMITAKRLNKPRSLITLNGNEWADQRKPAQEKMLRPAVVASYVPLIEKVTNDLIEKIRKKPVIDDLVWEMANYTTESVGMLCFNKRLGCLEAEKGSMTEISKIIAELLGIMQRSFFFVFKAYMYFRTPVYKQFENAGIKFYNTVAKEITEQKEFLSNIEKDGQLQEYLDKEPNFMYSLLADGRLSDDQINSLIGDLFMAGIDSTANTLVFLLANLSLNPDKQTKLYEEIQQVVGDSPTLTKEHLAQMSYLKACLRESHRITFPISLGVFRRPETDLAVGGYLIPKDTIVAINNRAMCADDRFFPRPTEYLPERWLRDTTGELAQSKEFPFAHKPFGFGPRSCIGQRFAENEIFIAAVKIIKNFEVSMPPDVKEIETTLKIFTTPVNDVKMTFTERKQV